MDNTQKINFFKKIWYSIGKPSKYEEMGNEGVGAALKYLFTILSLFAIILAIIATVLQVSVVNDAISYLDENLPDIKFQNNELSLENGEATILDDEKIKQYFGSTIVINPLLEEDKAITEYNNLATDKNSVIVFLNEEFIIITNKYNQENKTKDGIQITKYADISGKYIQDTTAVYNKNSVITYIKQRTSYTYYIAQYFVYYIFMLAMLYVLYIALIALSLWIVTKVSKISWTIKKSFINTIYASTLSIMIYVLYMIISYFAKFRINFMDIISIITIFIYIYILLRNERLKKNKPKEEEQNEER